MTEEELAALLAQAQTSSVNPALLASDPSGNGPFVIDPSMMTPGPAEPLSEYLPVGQRESVDPVAVTSSVPMSFAPEAGPAALPPQETDVTPQEPGSGLGVVRGEAGMGQLGGRMVIGSPSAPTPTGAGRAPDGAMLTIRPELLGAGDIEQANLLRMQGLAQQAEIGADEALQRATLFDEQAEGDAAMAQHLSQIAEEHDQASRREIQDLASLVDQMAANRIDPNRMFSGPGGSSARLGAAAAIAGGFISSVYTQQPNAALDIINRAIEHDLQAQLANQQQGRAVFGAQRTLIDAMRQAYGDDVSALQAARVIRTQEAANRLQALAARASAPQQQAKLNELLGSLRAQMLYQMNEAQANRWQIAMQTDRRLVPAAMEAFRQEAINNRRTTLAQEVYNTGLQAAAGQMAVEASGGPSGAVAPSPARGVAGTPRSQPAMGTRAAPGAMRTGMSTGGITNERGVFLGIGSDQPLPPGYTWDEQPYPYHGRLYAVPLRPNGVEDRALFEQISGIHVEDATPEQIMAQRTTEGTATLPASILPPGASYIPDGGAEVYAERRSSTDAATLSNIMNSWHTFERAAGRLLREMSTTYGAPTPASVRQRAWAQRLSGVAQLLQKMGNADAQQEIERQNLLTGIMGGEPGLMATGTQRELLQEWIDDARTTVANRAREMGLRWSPPGNSAAAIPEEAPQEEQPTPAPGESGAGLRGDREPPLQNPIQDARTGVR